MKFKITSSGNFYSEVQANKLEKIGFKFEKDDTYKELHNETQYKISEGVDMEIITLDDLIAFIKKYGHVIVDEDTIEIYDDYRE